MQVTLETVLYAINKRHHFFGDNFEFHTDPLLCALTKLMGNMVKVSRIPTTFYIPHLHMYLIFKTPLFLAD